jgi:hypothetical protein
MISEPVRRDGGRIGEGSVFGGVCRLEVARSKDESTRTKRTSMNMNMNTNADMVIMGKIKRKQKRNGT